MMRCGKEEERGAEEEWTRKGGGVIFLYYCTLTVDANRAGEPAEAGRPGEESLRRSTEGERPSQQGMGRGEGLVKYRSIIWLAIVTNYAYCCICGLCVFLQGLKKSEGAGDKMQHLLKIREQSIQTLQQEMQVR